MSTTYADLIEIRNADGTLFDTPPDLDSALVILEVMGFDIDFGLIPGMTIFRDSNGDTMALHRPKVIDAFRKHYM